MTNLFGHSVRRELVVLYAADAVSCFVGVYGLMLWSLTLGAGMGATEVLVFSVALALCSGLTAGASGLYDPSAWMGSRRLLIGTAIAGVLLLPLTAMLILLLAPPGGGLRALPALLLACTTAIASTRLGLAAALRAGLFRRRVAVVRGTNGMLDAERAIGGSVEGAHGFEVALRVRADEGLSMALAPERLRPRGISMVVAKDAALLPADVRRRCDEAGIAVMGETEFFEQGLNRVATERLPADWLAQGDRAKGGPAFVAAQRTLDIVGSLVLLAISLPLMLLTALAIKLDSAGPVFYRQERVGLNGRTFTILKFRSMRTDAEAMGQPVWASRRDPRITRVGHIIRLTRIDEIPQILNVLRGEMALVGPRPERPVFVEQLKVVIPNYDRRALVKPGITGWAQVNYPYGASVEDARMKLAYDLYYVQHRSLFLDLLILVSTVRVVLFQEGSR